MVSGSAGERVGDPFHLLALALVFVAIGKRRHEAKRENGLGFGWCECGHVDGSGVAFDAGKNLSIEFRESGRVSRLTTKTHSAEPKKKHRDGGQSVIAFHRLASREDELGNR